MAEDAPAQEPLALPVALNEEVAAIDDVAPTRALAVFQYISTTSGGGYIGSWRSA